VLSNFWTPHRGSPSSEGQPYCSPKIPSDFPISLFLDPSPIVQACPVVFFFPSPVFVRGDFDNHIVRTISLLKFPSFIMNSPDFFFLLFNTHTLFSHDSPLIGQSSLTVRPYSQVSSLSVRTEMQITHPGSAAHTKTPHTTYDRNPIFPLPFVSPFCEPSLGPIELELLYKYSFFFFLLCRLAGTVSVKVPPVSPR